jgi:hypothetical protein
MVNDIQIVVEKQFTNLIRSLAEDGLREDASALEAIYAKRFIWGQMALRVSNYLDQMLQRQELPQQTKSDALKLRELLKPFCTFPHEKLIYIPARQLGTEIEHAGFPGWKEIIDEEISRGFSAGEIFDGLRYHLNRFLNETSGVPPPLQREVRRFVSKLG